MAAGELLLYVKPPEGDPVAVTVEPMATVGDVSQAVQRAFSLPVPPKLTFGGQELQDRAAHLADLGIGAQALLSYVTGLTIRIAMEKDPDEKIDTVTLDADCTLDHLLEYTAKKRGPAANYTGAASSAHPTRKDTTDVFFYWDREYKEEEDADMDSSGNMLQTVVQRVTMNVEGDDKTYCQIPPGKTLRQLGVMDGDKVIWIQRRRPQKRKGRPYAPSMEVEDTVSVLPQGGVRVTTPDEAELQQRAAQLWLKQAGEEQDSVAAFAALTLRLMAHGAPGALLDASLRAGQDEVRHATICRQFAQELGACGACPTALPPHRLEVAHRLTDLASRAVSEGAVGEAVAAASAALAASSASCPRVAAAQNGIAADEARHAALAWATAAWAAQQPGKGGAAVRAELASAAAGLSALGGTVRQPSAEERALLGLGHVEGAIEDAVGARVRLEFAVPALQVLAEGRDLDSICVVPCSGAADEVAQVLSTVWEETRSLLAACR
eukprot:TRINITY_DN20163_c0_g1_i1.p1 TRINITY_DN20163_c0_g1~~TRINITY_DN20163_c0_g1_i1.p1  ORF type:complete len:495 (+),score=91.02 TRINITY_DN20163_c0_g1_i1:85-1569(+)